MGRCGVRLGAAVALVSSFAVPSAVAQFVQIPVPATGGNTERLMFGDIDGDGDLDVVIANGGDSGNQQNRIWVNQGGAQGGTIGTFLDDTAARAPAIFDSSRDVELADIDGDGDPDAHVSNHANTTLQGCRWWINRGGLQGGAPGFFLDETPSRWLGLAQGPGTAHPYASSIHPSLLPGLNPPGGFQEWSGECGFGDVDNDGDLDLLQASHGPAHNGQVPTRIFLNDGGGLFFEFNPSGFQLSGTGIANGEPGLWCEGVQQHNTTNTTGQFCDVATFQLEAMFGDLDNDLDLDVFLGSRNDQPRAFFNRLEERGSFGFPGSGTLGFRDVTTYVYSVPATGLDNYGQNLADLDNDFDLDAYLLNYGIPGTSSLSDQVAFNDGTGRLVNFATLPASLGDDEEPDFLDLDSDGDMDLVVAAFGYTDRMYVNGPPIGTFMLYAGLPTVPGVTRDVDVADWDADGDYDAAWAVALNSNNNEVFMANQTTTTDATPPALKRVETVLSRVAGPSPTVVRVQVYDNSPLYQAGRNDTRLVVSIDGALQPILPMRYSGGQIFRGEIPGIWLGRIEYTAISTDEHGNTGIATTLGGAPDVKCYTATSGTNSIAYGTGTAGAGGLVPVLGVNSAAVGGNCGFALLVSSGLPGGAGWIVFSFGPQVPPLVLSGLSVNLALATVFLVLPQTPDAHGRKATAISIPFGLSGSVFAQFFGFDGAAPGGVSASAGLQVNL